MGVSFQVSKSGTRYKCKVVLPAEDKDKENGSDDPEVIPTAMGVNVVDPSSVLVKSPKASVVEDMEVSFSLNLFENGFSVGRASELFVDVPGKLHPYDRDSETLFSAIEYGCLPGAVFDDLPCQYVNGASLCEIQDYRGCFLQGRTNDVTKKHPVVHKVLLHMQAENVVKDILSVSDDSWTYRDFLEVESRILKALQPDLHLHPQQSQQRCFGKPLRKKVDLGIMWSWKKRKHTSISEIDRDSSNSDHVTTNSPTTSVAQNSSSVLGQSCQEKRVAVSEHNSSTSAVNQENIILLQSSKSSLLTSQPKHKVGESCNMSAVTMMPTSVDVPKRSLDNSNNTLSSSVPGEKVMCETQAVKVPLLKIPKLEPVDISFEQFNGSQTESILLPYQQQNKLLHQQTEDGRIIHERIRDKLHSSVLGKRVRSETQASNGPLIRKPKLEQVDIPSKQLVGNQSENALLPYQRKKKLLHLRTEDGKFVHERFQDILHPSVLGKRVGSETQVLNKPPLKKPKLEPVDLYFEEITGSQTENTLLRYRQQNKLLQQQIEGGKALHEKFQDKGLPSLIMNNCQKINFQRTSELQAGPATSDVISEPAKVSSSNSSVRMRTDNNVVMDMRDVQSSLPQLQKQVSSTLLKKNIPIDTSRKHMSQPVDTHLRDSSVTQMRKNVDKYEVMTGERHGTTSYQNINSMPRDISIPSKLKENYPIKSQLPEAKVHSFLERFSEIQVVTKRYELHKKKNKSDKILSCKPLFFVPLLKTYVSTCLNLLECSMDCGVHISQMRILTFAHRHHGYQVAQIKLAILKKLNGGMEANVFHAAEEMFSMDFSLPQAFHSTHSANLLAAQFTSLMVREGYYLASDQVKSQPSNPNGGLSSQCNLASILTPSTRGDETSSIPTPWSSPFRFSSMSSTRSANKSMQLPTHNIFSGGQSLPIDPTQSAVPTVGRYSQSISQQHLKPYAQISLEPQQQILDGRVLFQYQALQRQLQRYQLNQMTKSRLGMIQDGGALQLHGSKGDLCSCGNHVFMKSSSSPMALAGQLPCVRSVGRSNNVSNQMSGNFLGSNDLASVLSKLRAPFQGNAGTTPIHMMQQPQQNIVHHQQQDMISLIQHSTATNSLAEPQSQVSSRQQFDQQPSASHTTNPTISGTADECNCGTRKSAAELKESQMLVGFLS